jgi:hypothetical protein
MGAHAPITNAAAPRRAARQILRKEETFLGVNDPEADDPRRPEQPYVSWSQTPPGRFKAPAILSGKPKKRHKALESL